MRRQNKKNICDLHTHTYYSDGRASPSEIIRYAKKIGIKVMAITDHDTANGSREGVYFANKLGIKLIPAIEFTSHWDKYISKSLKNDIDVLGYGIDLYNENFKKAANKAINDIHERIEICCSIMTRNGYDISIKEVFLENCRYAGLKQLAQASLKKFSLPNIYFAQNMVESYWKSVRTSSFHIDQIISIIHDAGGIGILAHPSTMPVNNGILYKEDIKELVEMGLDGLEVFHPKMNRELRIHYYKLAQKFKLIISGGSDEHGWPSGFPVLGSEYIPNKFITRIIQ